MQNQLQKLYDEDFFNNFVRIGYLSLAGRNTVFCDVMAYMDDKFLYLDNGDYRMMYPVSSIKKIVLRTDEIE